MGKELETIAQVTSSGDLRNNLVEAEAMKVEIEAILLKRVSSVTNQWNEMNKNSMRSHIFIIEYIIGRSLRRMGTV